MSLITTPGDSLWEPGYARFGLAPSFSSGAVIDATGEKVAMIGSFRHKDRVQKTVTRLGFRFGAVTKAGGSALTVSLQDLDNVNGQPGRPDGTQDQTVAIANANASFVSNTWCRTDALSASRNLTPGDPIAVVWEFDGAGRLGADSVVISGLAAAGSGHAHGSSVVLFTSAWNDVLVTPNVVFECDDGSFGTLDGAFVISDRGSTAFNSGSVADEIGLQFVNYWPRKIDGLWALLSAAADANFEINAYQGTSLITNGSGSRKADHMISTGVQYAPVALPGQATLEYNQTYIVAVKPTTANNVTIQYFDVAVNGHFNCHPFGVAGIFKSRSNEGEWDVTTDTRRPFIGIRPCAFDDGLEHGIAALVGGSLVR